MFGPVIFILNFTDEFFQHILQGEQAHDLAIFIDDDSHMNAPAAEYRQQVVNMLIGGDEEGGTSQLFEV